MHRSIMLSALLSASLSAQQTTATINIQQAVANCQEGIKQAERMKAAWQIRLGVIERREAEIKTERETLERDSKRRHGIWPFRHVMGAKERVALSRQD